MTDAIREGLSLIYTDVKGVEHHVNQIHVTTDEPYTHIPLKKHAKNPSIKLLTFDDFFSFYKFLDKFPIHNHVLLNFQMLLQIKFV